MFTHKSSICIHHQLFSCMLVCHINSPYFYQGMERAISFWNLTLNNFYIECPLLEFASPPFWFCEKSRAQNVLFCFLSLLTCVTRIINQFRPGAISKLSPLPHTSYEFIQLNETCNHNGHKSSSFNYKTHFLISSSFCVLNHLIFLAYYKRKESPRLIKFDTLGGRKTFNWAS